MQNPRFKILALACSAFCFITLAQAVVESNFDDQTYPGSAGTGWTEAWQHTAGNQPAIATDNPLDGGTPYLHYGTAVTGIRNLARQYDASGDVDPNKPHSIRWKFRLEEADFASNFTVFNDRVHFFARNALRLTGSTDTAISWSVMATGGEQTAGSGLSAGQTFWIFDNVDGSGAFNMANHVDSQIQLLPNNIYAFEVLVDPAISAYTVAITNLTSGASFKSGAPHRFRAAGVTGTSHTILHFGVQASPSTDLRYFDMDSVSVKAWGGPSIENINPGNYFISRAQDGLRFDVVAPTPVPASNISLKLNGGDVSSGLHFSGTETHRTVAYSNLVANQKYVMEVNAYNGDGNRTLIYTFYTTADPMTLYDSGGFTSNDIYPVGRLPVVTHGDASWQPHSTEPSEIRDDPVDGKVLDRENWAEDRSDYLHVPPLASGTLTIQFKARVSRADTRTMDVSLLPQTGGLMSSLVGWGVISGKVASYDGTAWQALADLDTGWHTYKLIHYLSGPAAGYYDLVMDGAPIGERLPWRNAIPVGSPFSRVRLHADPAGAVFEYCRVDDLVVTAAPEDPNAFAPPAISNIDPFNYAVVPLTAQIRFDVDSALPIAKTNIGLRLNGTDVTADLAVTGTNGNRNVTYAKPLIAGRYAAEITATNTAGQTTATFTFVAADQPFTVFDSEGFESDELYPLGPMQAVTNGLVRWAPAANPSEFLLIEDPHKKVLQRPLSSAGSDAMEFPPAASGILIIDVDILASSVASRNVDFCLLRPGSGANEAMGSFLCWGVVPDNLAHYNGSAWVPVAQPGTTWNHYTIINYLSGANASHFDLKINGTLAGQNLRFRNIFQPQTALGRLRFGALTASAGNYGQFDNLKISVQSLPVEVNPVSIQNPGFIADRFSFSFVTQEGVSHVVRYKAALTGLDWTVLETITGDGSLKTLSHTNPPAGQLFYQVVSQRP